MPSTRSCDGEAAGCASAAACMRASIVGAAMEDLEKGARETSRESQATHARRQDRPEGWIRRRPNDADWVRNVLLQEASSASGNLRSGFSTLCGGWCRRTANFPTGFRASAVGSPCTEMRAVARHDLCCGGRTLKMRRLGARWSALRSLNTQRPLRETKGVKVVR